MQTELTQNKKKSVKNKIEIFNSKLDTYIEKHNVKINDIDRATLKIYYRRHVADGFIKSNTITEIIKKLGLS